MSSSYARNIYLYIYIYIVSLSHSISISISLSLYLSIHPSIYLSIHPSIYLSVLIYTYIYIYNTYIKRWYHSSRAWRSLASLFELLLLCRCCFPDLFQGLWQRDQTWRMKVHETDLQGSITKYFHVFPTVKRSFQYQTMHNKMIYIYNTFLSKCQWQSSPNKFHHCGELYTYCMSLSSEGNIYMNIF